MNDGCPLNREDCPSTEDFDRYLKHPGSLGPQDIERIELCVDECESCGGRLHALNASFRVLPDAGERGPRRPSAEEQAFAARLKERWNNRAMVRSLGVGQCLGPYGTSRGSAAAAWARCTRRGTSGWIASWP